MVASIKNPSPMLHYITIPCELICKRIVLQSALVLSKAIKLQKDSCGLSTTHIGRFVHDPSIKISGILSWSLN